MSWVSVANIMGPTGEVGKNAFNITSGPFIVPPEGGTVEVTLEDASWVAPGQMVYVDRANESGEAGAMVVMAKNGNILTLQTPPPPSPGPAGQSAIATTLETFVIPAMGATGDVLVEDASSFAVGQFVGLAGAGDNGEVGTLKIVAINGETLTLLNPEVTELNFLTDAPDDGEIYGRQDRGWVLVSGAKGDTGATGEKGDTGATGQKGESGILLAQDETEADTLSAANPDTVIFFPEP